MKTLVIGGGLAGLAAAYRLSLRGAEVVLLERDARPGGKITTEKRAGFVLEGGPDSFVSYKPALAELCRELGLGSELQPAEPLPTLILCGGRLEPLPEGVSIAFTKMWPMLATRLLTWKGKLRAGWEPFVPPQPEAEDESLRDFVARRLGPEFYERVAEPLLAGVYGGDPATLSVESTFPRLRELERRHGSLVKGLRARGGGPPGPLFWTIRGGLSTVVEALRSKLGAALRLETEVSALARTGGGWRADTPGGSFEAPAVVLAAPAFDAARLLAESLPETAALVGRIPYGPAGTVSFGFADGGALPRASGFLAPASEGLAMLGCTFSSLKYPGRAPAGSGLVRAYLGSRGDWLREPDEAVARLALREIKDALALPGEPLFAVVRRWARGMPQYRLGHETLLRSIESSLEGVAGLVLAGSPYRGIGLPDCVESGGRAAEAAAEGRSAVV